MQKKSRELLPKGVLRYQAYGIYVTGHIVMDMDISFDMDISSGERGNFQWNRMFFVISSTTLLKDIYC